MKYCKKCTLISLIFLIFISLCGCSTNEDSAKKDINIGNKFDNKIFDYEIITKYEKKLDANGNILGFGLYGNAELHSFESVTQKIKIYCSRIYFGERKKDVIFLDLYDENYPAIIIYDADIQNEYIEFGNSYIIHLNKDRAITKIKTLGGNP